MLVQLSHYQVVVCDIYQLLLIIAHRCHVRCVHPKRYRMEGNFGGRKIRQIVCFDKIKIWRIAVWIAPLAVKFWNSVHVPVYI